MLIPHWLKSLRNSLHRPVRSRVSKKRRHQRAASRSLTSSVESLEDRLLLAGAGPQLISIFPNDGVTLPEETGRLLQQNEVLDAAPRELVFRFNPGQAIDPASLEDGILVFRSGFDGSFANGRVPVEIGSIQIGDQPNEVIVRFANTLPDDQYQILLVGSGGDPLRNTGQNPFNNGVDLSFFFEVDLGAQIEAVVHEPVVRTQNLTVTNSNALVNGSSFTVQAGGKPITFEFDSNGQSNADGDNVFAIDISDQPSNTVLASRINAAIGTAANVHGAAFGLTSFDNGATVQISAGPNFTFSPDIIADSVVASALTITDGAIEQREDTINVFFNDNDPLNAIGRNTLIVPDVVANGTFLIPDGEQFTVDTGSGPLTFTMDSGPSGVFNISVLTDNVIRDGDFIEIDGTRYEFDTGPLLEVTATDLSGITIGQTFTLQDNGGRTRTFEFTAGNAATMGNLAVDLTGTTTRATIAARIASAINAEATASAFSVTAQALNNNSGRISLNNILNDASVIVPAQTGFGRTGTLGVAGGSVQVSVKETFSSAQVAQALSDVVNTPANPGFNGGLVNFAGFTTIDGFSFTSPSIFQDRQTTGENDPQSIDYYVGQSAAQLSATIAAALDTQPGITATNRAGMVKDGWAVQIESGQFATNQGSPFQSFSNGNPSTVESPAFYQLINSDGTLRLPDEVIYNADAGVATLRFNNPLRDGTYNIQIGESFEATNTIATIVNLGTRFGSSTIVRNDFIGGDPTTTSLDMDDVDLYQFNILTDTIGNDLELSLTTTNGLDGIIRVFQETGPGAYTEVFSNIGTPVVSGTGRVDFQTGMLTAGNYLVAVSSDGNIAYDPADGSGRTGGTTTGSYLLTIRPNVAEVDENPDGTPNANFDDNSSFETPANEATNLGVLGTSGQVVRAVIEPQTQVDLPPEPGGNDEPGHRDIPVSGENHIDNVDGNLGIGNNVNVQDPMIGRGTEPTPPTPIYNVAYTFQSFYGQDDQGFDLFNAIQPEQRQRAREVFELFSRIAGINVVEAASVAEAQAQGIFDEIITVVTGDLAAVGLTSGPGGVLGVQSVNEIGTIVIMDAAENFSAQDNQYGNIWFKIAMHEIGHALDLDHAYDLSSIMGDAGSYGTDPLGGLNGEPIFPSANDVVHLRRLYRRDAIDVDMYQFEVTEAGTVTIETLAERFGVEDGGASQADTVLRLYQQVQISGAGTPDPSDDIFERTLIAQNDDYFGNDSFISLRLTEGTYFIGVSSLGNENYDPSVANSGSEGLTDGPYELRIDIVPDLEPIPNDLGLIDPTDVGPQGRSAIRDTDDSLQFNGNVRKANAIDGDADGNDGGTHRFSFQVGETIFVDKATGADTGADGSLGNPFKTIDDAFAAANARRMTLDSMDDPTPVIVRIVGNTGTDGRLDTLGDNDAYEIGLNLDTVNPGVLEDGGTFQVPRDVNVVIDAGANFKLQAANFDVGSSAQGLDRSGGSLQILGTTFHDVIITSFNDNTVDTVVDARPPARGQDWGGIVFREDSDYDFEFTATDTQRNIFIGNNPEYTFTGFPSPATDGRLTFTAFGDFSEPGEFLTIQFLDTSGNEIPGQSFNIFDDNTGLDAGTITVTRFLTKEQLEIVASTGEIRLRVIPSNGVGVDNQVNDINVVESLRVDLSVGAAVPIFLNTVNHATIQYGGGQVRVDGNDNLVFDPIHLITNRPTITFNTITLNAGSAISANPNSFDDTFEDVRRYDHRLDRLGPDVHGNNVFDNSFNAFKIRTLLPNSDTLEKLTVPARLTSTDIVHFFSESLLIDGGAGGLIIDPGDDASIVSDDVITARTPGRLRVDPGVIIKLNESRIELERGNANLIAEGTPEDPIIFTSLNDDSVGAGGSFDTGNDGAPFQDLGLETLDITWTAQGPTAIENGQVENVSPNNQVAGAIHTAIAHPTNPDRLWIGAVNGGVWRTDDATSASPTWVPLTDSNVSLSIGAMALDPNNPDRLLVGIGRFSSFGREGGALTGLLLSEDGGDSFAVINPPLLQGENISGVAINGSLILVTANSLFGTGGLYRSVDSGATFTRVSGTSGLVDGGAFDLVSDPTNPQRFYVTIQDEGVYRTDTGGASWLFASGDPAVTAAFTGAIDNNNAEMAVASNGRVYLSVIDQGQPIYIGYSDDQGSTWIQMDLPQTPESDGDIEGLSPRVKPGGQGAIHFSIIADPNDPNIVYVGGDRQDGPFPNFIEATNFTGRLFRGDTTVDPTFDTANMIPQDTPSPQWEHLTHSDTIAEIPGGGTANDSAPHADSREIVFLANGDMIEVDDGGIYRRTNPQDNTGDWFSIVGNLQVAEIHNIAYDSLTNTILVGTQDNANQTQLPPGILSPTAGTDPWSVLGSGDGGDVKIDDRSSPTQSTRYLSAQFLFGFRREVYDNTDLINPIQSVDIDTSVVVDPQFVTPIALNAVDPRRLVVGGSGNIYESFNQGDGLAQVAGVGVNSPSTLVYGGFIGNAPNINVLWVGSGNQVFLRSAANGPVSATNYTGGTVRAIITDPNDWRVAFVADSDQIFMTTDAGQTFLEITGTNIFDTDIESIAYVEGPAKDALLIGGDNGVFAMDLDNIGVWFNVGTNLPNAPVFDMEYDSADDVLVVGTLGRGAFAITNAAQIIEAELIANAPDPIGLTPQPGDWAGLIFNAESNGNLDYVELRYGGGLTPDSGGNASFNPIEIIQADVRISNSIFEENANGLSPGNSVANRFGRGQNTNATIFVRGAQPTIVLNVFQNNEGNVISIDANSMISEIDGDPGRASGPIFSRPRQVFNNEDPFLTTEFENNAGPLVRNNRIDGNQFNGMEIRGGLLNTEATWDDTDIVHILRSEIVIPNLHTFGGLRLQSTTRESLVVKLDGPNAGLTASGEEFDIVDRVGGTLEVIGTPGRPVIFTSLYDDSIGAGFRPDNTPLLETVDPNDPSDRAAQPGDWRSLLLDQFSNDRNVAVYNERERATRLDRDINNLPSIPPDGPEPIGILAPGVIADPSSPDGFRRATIEQIGDDNQRAGFEIHGFINTDDPTDQDIYSFIGTAGSEVWFDIDRTAGSLDTVLELVNATGQIVFARSDDSQAEVENPQLLDPNGDGLIGLPLRKDERLGGDFYTTNPKDAGMRLILPGDIGTQNTYFIRVRSKGASLDNLTNDTNPGTADGLTSGEYQLQIRLRQRDEHPGSTIIFSQVRFADTGIHVVGQPGHSPLVGEAGETPESTPGLNDSVANATNLGNILQSDLNTISVAGNLSDIAGTLVADDLDFYRFEVDYGNLSPGGGGSASLTFDIDYADGLARANSSLHIFQQVGNTIQLILTATDSNIADDRPAPQNADDLDDPSRGTVGPLDPFIGSIELGEGTYWAVVTAENNRPVELNQFSVTNPNNDLLRLEPLRDVFRIAADRIGGNNSGTSQDNSTLTTIIEGNSVVPWHLGDVSLIVSRDNGNNSTELLNIDPFTGAVEATLGSFNQNVEDIDINRRTDNGQFSTGEVIGFQLRESNPIPTDTNTGAFLTIDTDNGNTVNAVNTGIRTQIGPGVGISFTAISYDNGVTTADEILGNEDLQIYGVGNRNDWLNDGIPNSQQNILYEFIETGLGFTDNNPRVIGSGGTGTNIVERGILNTDFDAGSGAGTALLVPDPVDGDNILLFDGALIGLEDTGMTISPTFEMDAGPHSFFSIDLAADEVIRDGDYIVLDGVTYEFDTGVVLDVVAADDEEVSVGIDQTITIRDNVGSTRVYELRRDSNGPVTAGADIAINIAGANSPDAIAALIADAITMDPNSLVVATPLLNGTGRITLENDVVLINQVTTGVETFGNYGPTFAALTNVISAEETSDGLFLAEALSDVVNTRDGFSNTQVNFPTFDLLEFDTEVRDSFLNPEIFQDNVITDVGGVAPGNIEIDYWFGEEAQDVASDIEDAINTFGAPFTANSTGAVVQLTGGTYTDPGTSIPPFQIGGTAPGGIITGMSVVDRRLFAVTNTGGLFEVLDPTARNNSADPLMPGGASLRFIDSPVSLQGINFEGLTTMPANVEGGFFTDILVGISATGELHAFNINGQFEEVFLNGATSISTGVTNVTGVSFSNLDFNLWHTTDDRRATPGSGGGDNFAFTNERADNVADPTNPPNNSYGFLTGGAHGTAESGTFSLEGYSAGDQPTLYFSYYLETEDANGGANQAVNARDAFRVFIADSDGEWDLITTNNSNETGVGPASVSNNAPFAVQQTFDNTTGRNNWRQARVDLSAYAGKPDLQLRFEFSTAASLNVGDVFTGGDELRAVDGDTLRDGNTFEIDTLSGGAFTRQTFEIDLGHTLVLPPASQIADGETLEVNGLEFTFRENVLSAGTTIGFRSNFTANQMAQAVANQVGPLAPGVTARVNGQRVHLEGATSVVESTNVLANGTIIQLPNGGRLIDEETVTVDGVTFEFNSGFLTFGPGIEIPFDGTFTNDEIALALFNAIQANTNANAFLEGETITVYDAPVTNGRATGFGPTTIQVAVEDDGLSDPNHIPVVIHADMSANEVAAVIRQAIADDLLANPVDLQHIKTYRNVVRVIGHDVVDAGRLGLTSVLPTNTPIREFGEFDSAFRGRNNNAFEGVYIDNIIIGFAERGENVFSAGNTTDFTLAGSSETIEGNYQLEIRRGTEVSIGDFSASALTVENILDTNDRLTDQITVTIPDGEELFDGQRFQLSDGVNTIVFEFEDAELVSGDPNFGIRQDSDFAIPFRASEPGHVIAARLRDLLNSNAPEAPRTRLEGISAALAEGSQLTGPNVQQSPNNTSVNFGGFSREVNIFGAITAAVNGSVQAGGAVNDAFPEIEPNDTIATAQSLDGLSFTLDPNVNIHDQNLVNVSTAFPHVTISGSGDESFDYYSFTIENDGDTAIFDIDGSNFDTMLFLYDPITEMLITSDDDGAQLPGNSDPGSASGLDSFLQFTFPTAGTYVIGVARFPSAGPDGGIQGTPPQFGDFYTLNIAIENKTVGGGASPFNDFFNLNGFLDFEVSADTPNEALHIGDSNTERVQGSIQISQNFIFDTANVGILIDDSVLRPGTDQPIIGTVRQLPTPNQPERFTRGVKISNNVVAHFGDAGIVVNGSDNAGNNGGDAAVPFHRLINNTIYGGETPNGDGVRVTNNSAPTLLNNIIANTNIAINSDNSPGNAIEVFRSTYQNNGQDGINGGGIASTDQLLVPGEPLFVDPTTNNFYLAAGARPIDSARNQLDDRFAIADVGDSIGLPQSNLFAPDFDAFGQLRTDDEDTTPNTGSGNPPFYDRGAIEREDTRGPSARLIAPEDNDLGGMGNDLDPANTFVFLENAVIRQFIVGLDDVGIGIDDTSVITDNVILTFTPPESTTPRVLESGVDYLFRYNTNTKQITLEAASGVFVEGTYEISLVNDNGVRDLAGNDLEPNRQPAGTTAFQITIAPPPVLTVTQPVVVVEGDAGSTFAEITVTLSGPTQLPVTADVSVTEDGRTGVNAATVGLDFVAVPLDAQGNPIPGNQLVFDRLNDPNLDGDNNFLTQVIQVEIIGDVIVEGDETFQFILDNPSDNVQIGVGSGQVIGTINDDDVLIELEAVDIDPVLEGDGGMPAQVVTFRAFLTDKAGVEIMTAPLDISVDYTTVDGTAVSIGATPDFVAITDTIDFFSGNPASQLFAIEIVGDTIQEPMPIEDFIVNLVNPRNASFDSIDLTTRTATGQIQDDDPKFNISDAVVLEGEFGENRQAVFTVTVSSGVIDPITLEFSTLQTGAAIDGVDYVGVTNGTVVFDPLVDPNLDGDNNPLTRQIAIDIIGDSLVEGSETFSLMITNSSAGGFNDDTGVATIEDDDIRINITDVSELEGNSGTRDFEFVVTLTDPDGNPVPAPEELTIEFETSIGSNVVQPGPGVTFEANNGSTFTNPEQLNPSVFVRTQDNNIHDRLGNDTSTTIPHATILGRGDGTFDYFAFNGTMDQRLILDIDGATFDSRIFLFDSAGNVVASNDDGFATGYSMNGVPTNSTSDPGSINGTDAFLDVVLVADGTYTFAIGRTDSTANNAGLMAGPSTNAIENGDQYTLHVSLEDFDLTQTTINEVEPNDIAPAAQNVDSSFTLEANSNINNAGNQDVSTTIPHVTIVGTGNDTADFYSFTGTTGATAIVDIDQTSVNFDSVITILDPNGSILATNDDNAIIDSGSATTFDSFLQVTLPADGLYRVQVTGVNSTVVPAGESYQLNIAVTGHPVSGGGGAPVIADGTADPGSDFDPAAIPSDGTTGSMGQLVIPMGDTSGTITVRVNGDTINEPPSENFFVRLTDANLMSGDSGPTIVDGTGEGVIGNDDAPFATINNPSAEEFNPDSNTITFIVTLDRPADVPTTIDFVTIPGSAFEDVDYVGRSGQLSFAIGEIQQEITIELIRDGVLNEGDETFTVRLSNAIGASFPNNVPFLDGIGTIIDNSGFVENLFTIVAPDAGREGTVLVLDRSGATRFQFDPYPGFFGGVRVATGDINNDGTPDIITVPGPGGGPHVRAFSGVDGTDLLNGGFLAMDGLFAGGLFVAAGDLNGDSFDDIIVSADAGGGAFVQAFSPATGTGANAVFTPLGIGSRPKVFEVNAYPGFTGGVRVAAGDVIGDGTDDIITVPGAGGGPHVLVFDAANRFDTGVDVSFFAYSPNFTGGLYVASGNIDISTGKDEIITAPGAGGGPHVRVLNVQNIADGAFRTSVTSVGNGTGEFFAYSPALTSGVRVSTGFVNDDTILDVVTAPGPGGGPHIKAFFGDTISDGQPGVTENPGIFPAQYPTFTGGLFIAGITDIDVQPSAQPLRAAQLGTGDASGVLTQADLVEVVDAAIDRLRSLGVSEDAIDDLTEVRFTVGDLSGDLVGLALNTGIVLDVNAAGNGWFIDPTPDADEEYASVAGNQSLTAIEAAATGRTDLLTVVLHELGHKLGLTDLQPHLHPDALMTATLPVGTRRLPTSEELDHAFTDGDLFDSLLLD